MSGRVSMAALTQLVRGADRARLEGVLLELAARPYDRSFIARALRAGDLPSATQPSSTDRGAR